MLKPWKSLKARASVLLVPSQSGAGPPDKKRFQSISTLFSEQSMAIYWGRSYFPFTPLPHPTPHLLGWQS